MREKRKTSQCVTVGNSGDWSKPQCSWPTSQLVMWEGRSYMTRSSQVLWKCRNLTFYVKFPNYENMCQPNKLHPPLQCQFATSALNYKPLRTRPCTIIHLYISNTKHRGGSSFIKWLRGKACHSGLYSGNASSGRYSFTTYGYPSMSISLCRLRKRPLTFSQAQNKAWNKENISSDFLAARYGHVTNIWPSEWEQR